MAETAKKFNAGQLILGLALTAVTVFTITWVAAKGWNSGSK